MRNVGGERGLELRLDFLGDEFAGASGEEAVFEELQGLVFGGGFEGGKRGFALGEFLPTGGDGDHLLVEADGARSVDGDAAEDDDARGAVLALREAGAGEIVMDEALGEEATEEAAGDAVLEVDLDRAVVNAFGRIEDDGTDGGLASPFPIALAVIRSSAEAVEGAGPGGVGTAAGVEVGEGPALGRAGEGREGMQRLCAEEIEGAAEGFAEVLHVEADVLARGGKLAVEDADLLLQLVAPLGDEGVVGIFKLFASSFDLVVLREKHVLQEDIDILAADAVLERVGEATFEDLGERAEFLLDGLGLADESLKDAVFGPLFVEEVAAGDDGRGLEFAVDTAVALFEAARVPGDIEVDEVVAMSLEVETFAGGVGADQDADGRFLRRQVEGAFDRLAFFRAGGAVEDLDAGGVGFGAADGGLEHVDEVTLRVVPLGEDDEAASGPVAAGAGGGLPGDADARALVLADPFKQLEDTGVGEVASGIGEGGHLVKEGPFGGDLAGATGGEGGALHLAILKFNEVLFREVRFIVIGFDRALEGNPPGTDGGAFAGPESFHAAAVDIEGAGEGLDRGEQALLQVGENHHRFVALAFASDGEAFEAEFAVFIEEAAEQQLGSVVGKAVDIDLFDTAFGEAAGDRADVFLEAADHDGVEVFLDHFDAAGEALRVEDFEEGAEAVGVAVVRRGGEKEAVFKAAGEIADDASELRVDGVARAAGGGGVVGFIEDEQRVRRQGAEPVAHRSAVVFVDEQLVRDEEARVSGPGVDAEAAFLADAFHVGAVHDLEDQAEAGFEFVFPLQQHRGRAGDDDVVDATAQQQFGGDESCFDGLAEADVIGDEEVDARHEQRLAQRLELVGIDADTSAEGRLEEARIGGGDAVPAQAVDVGAEEADLIKAFGADAFPGVFTDDFGAQLHFPDDLGTHPLGVVIDTGEAEQGTDAGGGLDRFDQVMAGADLDDIARFRELGAAHEGGLRRLLAGNIGAAIACEAEDLLDHRHIRFY